MEKRLIGGKMLKQGYTTGTCAGAAAKAASFMLLAREACFEVNLTTPSGVSLKLEVEDAFFDKEYASCAIRKDAGDDPDITDGYLIYAKVSKIAAGIEITGGQGVGLVTKPGLNQPVGAHAINSVPRRFIEEECQEVCRQQAYEGGLKVEISIPGGEALAKRTFNPRLGIEGGLSILGTTGIVEPMSQNAIVETNRIELSILREAGHTEVLLTIGNYGENFAKKNLGLSMDAHVKCSNFIGETLAAAAEKGFEKALLVGHIGKIVKLGIGITNTHSSHGDGRIETLIACALEAGSDLDLLKKIRNSVSTDAAVEVIREYGLLEKTLAILKERVRDTLDRHVIQSMEVGLVCFGGRGDDMEELFRI